MNKEYDIALRPLHDNERWLDDIVVNDCDVHLEQMEANDWLLICNLKKGGRVAFAIIAEPEGIRTTVNFFEDTPKDLVYEKGGQTLKQAEKLNQ